MKDLFVGIARYMVKHPECRKKSAFDIYNAYFSLNPCGTKNLDDVKLVVDYINGLKCTPENLLIDSLREG